MTDLETQVIESGETENSTCSTCFQDNIAPEHMYLMGVQEPENKRVALIRVCRICLVSETQNGLRGALATHWYADTR